MLVGLLMAGLGVLSGWIVGVGPFAPAERVVTPPVAPPAATPPKPVAPQVVAPQPVIPPQPVAPPPAPPPEAPPPAPPPEPAPEPAPPPEPAPQPADVPLPPARPLTPPKPVDVPRPPVRPADAPQTRIDTPPVIDARPGVYVRIFKQEGVLELWKSAGGLYALAKTYPICKWSGKLGPKLKEGDYQSPEGFYSVNAKQLNPNSTYHRAFNVGYPNAYDAQNKRTGSALMVHGNCVSVGCYAMTDVAISEIYATVEAALGRGQSEIPVHIFPFRMTDRNLAANADSPWQSFWLDLQAGYAQFEETKVPPKAWACNGRYIVRGDSAKPADACTQIAGW